MSSSSRSKLKVMQYRIRNMRDPANVLIVGPSATRKNAAILRVMENSEPTNEGLVIVTAHPELYDGHTVFLAEDGIPAAAQAKTAEMRVIEDIPTLRASDFKLFEKNTDITTVIAVNDYTHHVPKSAAPDYIILFGGVQELQRVWQDFAQNRLKFEDFREIYLAATDEGDRYSDEFMFIKTDAELLSDMIYWGSLRRAPLKEISVDVELVLNKVHQAEIVKVPKRVQRKAVPKIAPTVRATAAPEQQQSSRNADEDAADEDATDDRGDCCIQ